jgi:diaminopropionate ammonia-lyase
LNTAHTARPWLPNPARDRTWTCSPVSRDVIDFHRGLAGYAPTRLVDLPALAAGLGVGRLLVKDESHRLGLPAFKSLGASWAIHRALHDRLRSDAEGPSGTPVTLVAATDGNHGRAVARFSRLLGHRARIFVPDGVHPAAVQAIRDEGAEVTTVPADYDEAVRTAASYAADGGGLLVQDTAWNGYEEVPGWIVDGYSTLFRELDDQLNDLGIEQPDIVLVPTGVGSLLQAGLTHYRVRTGADTAVVSVEPVQAACVQASVAAGHPVSVATGHTIMAGLNCGTVSSLAWPSIHRGLDATATVTDDQATLAARALAENGVPVGPCGAAPLAAAQTLATGRDLGHQVSSRTTLVLIATEGESANPVALPPPPPAFEQTRRPRAPAKSDAAIDE